MGDRDGRIVVRGYRTVFAFERRLYRFDQWRIPLRGGLPVRALLYAPVVYGLLLTAGALPGIRVLVALLPDPIRWAVLPLAVTVALVHVELDGRPAHRALWALARWKASPRWLAGLRCCPPPHGGLGLEGTLVVRHDWRGASYRSGTVSGPATVLLRRPGQLIADGPRRLLLHPQPGRPEQVGRMVEIPEGARLQLR